MSNYKTLVVCKHDGDNRNFLFYAPSFTTLENGDKVLVDTCNGEQIATVVTSCCTALSGSDVENAIRMICGAKDKELKKVVGKFIFRKFDYGDETNE